MLASGKLWEDRRTAFQVGFYPEFMASPGLSTYPEVPCAIMVSHEVARARMCFDEAKQFNKAGALHATASFLFEGGGSSFPSRLSPPFYGSIILHVPMKFNSQNIQSWGHEFVGFVHVHMLSSVLY